MITAQFHEFPAPDPVTSVSLSAENQPRIFAPVKRTYGYRTDDAMAITKADRKTK